MNPEHLEILKRSIDDFNQWRAENWNIKPDFSGADMRGMNLFKANLNEANFSGADLRNAMMVSVEARSANFDHADLSGVQAQGANFSMSDMTKASLRKANLMGASFQGCCLVEVDFSEANCTAAIFNNSNLSNAVFHDAIVKGANFAATNLNEADYYSEQFKDANIPLEMLGSLVEKKKPTYPYFYAFISFAVVFILCAILYGWVFTATEPGALNTKIRSRIHYQLGQAFMQLGMHKEAINQLEQTLLCDAKNAEAHNFIAHSYRELGDYPNAIKHYETYIKLVGLNNVKAQAAQEFIYKYKEKLNKK